jgi:hypothetical protein
VIILLLAKSGARKSCSWTERRVSVTMYDSDTEYILRDTEYILRDTEYILRNKAPHTQNWLPHAAFRALNTTLNFSHIIQ